jgi:hypothetical protein
MFSSSGLNSEKWLKYALPCSTVFLKKKHRFDGKLVLVCLFSPFTLEAWNMVNRYIH